MKLAKLHRYQDVDITLEDIVKSLIEYIVLGVTGIAIIGGSLYAKDELLHRVKKAALEKAHRPLVDMGGVASSVTRERD